MKTAFDVSQDIHVYLEEYPEGAFILGFSLLGGSDVLSGASPSLTEVTCEIVEAQLTQGAARIGGLTTRTEPGSLTLRVRSDDLDPNKNYSARIGKPIYLEVDQDGGSGVTLFTGTIVSSSVSYNAGMYPTVQIVAKDKLQKVLQDNYTLGYAAGTKASTILDDLFEAHDVYPSGFNDQGVAEFYTLDYEDALGSEILADVMDGELGYLKLSNDGSYYYFYERGNAPAGASLDIGSDHSTSPDHLCASSAASSYSADLLPNYVVAYLDSDPDVPEVFYNQDSIDVIGKQAFEFNLKLRNSGELDKWAGAATLGTSQFTIENITTPAIDRLGNLTNAATHTAPLVPIQVTLDYRGASIDQEMLIGRVTHLIDVNNWITELELWSK